MDIMGMLQIGDLDVFDHFHMEAKAAKRTVYTDKKNYLYLPSVGDDKGLCLVAHVDTVCRKGRDRVFEESGGIIKAYNKGSRHQAILGADDRAGCYALLELMRKDSRPAILLTNYEESGGAGVKTFINETKLWIKTRLFIEYDRRGCNSYVEYNPNPAEMHEWISQFNVERDRGGSFSDIMIITNQTKIPSFNMAIGYYHQHSDREFLDVAAMNLAIEKSVVMIDSFYAEAVDFGRLDRFPKKFKNSEYKSTQEVIRAPLSPDCWVKSPTGEDEDAFCVECMNLIGDGHKDGCSFEPLEEPDPQANFIFGNY